MNTPSHDKPRPGFLRALRNLLLWLAGTITLLLVLAATNPSVAAEAGAGLQVDAPYLDLHTGPGRGFPIFHVVEKSQTVTIEERRTDWFRVRTAAGIVGWAPRAQLEATLSEAGQPKRFRDLLLDDYLQRRVEAGGAWGRFKRDPMLKLWLHARLADTVGAELTAGQVQGAYSGTDYWALSLSLEPWSDRRLSPWFAIGLGRFGNTPNTSLVDAIPSHARLALATVGLRWHVAERFVLRLDGTLHTAFVSDQRSTEYRSVSAGLGFFF